MTAGGARHLLLYDGDCGLCDRLTRFVLARDREARFLFAPLASAVAREALARRGVVSDPDPGTFFVLADRGTPGERLLARSRAALFVARELGGRLRAAARLAALLPGRLRDAAYDAVASRRHRLFPPPDACLAPSAEHRARFLGDALPPPAAGRYPGTPPSSFDVETSEVERSEVEPSEVEPWRRPPA